MITVLVLGQKRHVWTGRPYRVVFHGHGRDEPEAIADARDNLRRGEAVEIEGSVCREREAA